MSYLNSFNYIYIFYFLFKIMIHVLFPIIFLSVYPYNTFIENTSDYFLNYTNQSITYNKMFYIYILFHNIFVGILDIFNIFIIDNKINKIQIIVASGSCVYSIIVSFLYLILYYSMLNTDDNDIQFFQFIGFLELLSIIIYIFLCGIYMIKNFNNEI